MLDNTEIQENAELRELLGLELVKFRFTLVSRLVSRCFEDKKYCLGLGLDDQVQVLMNSLENFETFLLSTAANISVVNKIVIWLYIMTTGTLCSEQEQMLTVFYFKASSMFFVLSQSGLVQGCEFGNFRKFPAEFFRKFPEK